MTMSPLTTALISYWQRLPSESLVARRKALDTTRERIRAGLESHVALVPFALGDVDDAIVMVATREYFAAAVCGAGAADAAITDITDWVRRGLALNRGAVFGALLVAGDEAVHERLAAQRLTLSEEEVAVLCRQLSAAQAPSVPPFLREWIEMLDGSEDPALLRQRILLASVLDGCAPAPVRLAAA